MVPHERKVFELLEAGASTASQALKLLEELVHHWPDHQDLVTALADCKKGPRPLKRICS